MRWLRVSAILAVAGALAAFSAIVAVGQITEERNPATATALPFASGFAQANEASLLIASTADPKAPDRFLEQSGPRHHVASLSLKAYAKEPLAAIALRNLALVSDAEGNLARARLMMHNAQLITRRSTSVNGWLIQDYARRKDFAGTLRSYDFSLRSSLAARRQLLPPLLEALSYPQMVQPLLALLRKRPAWEEDFWAEAFKHPNALENAAEVRSERAKDNYAGNESYDKSLLDALIDGGNFASAEKLYEALSHKEAAAGIVKGSSFDRPDTYPPLDWQLYFDDSMTADLSPAAGLLRISVFQNGEGRLARQLVALPGDRYVLSAALGRMDKANKDTLYVRIACAEAHHAADPGVRINIDRPEIAAPFQKPAGGCVYHWLELIARPPEAGGDVALELKSLSIHPQG